MLPRITQNEPDWWKPWEVFTADDAEAFWNDTLHECPEDYDQPWFGIVAVRAAEHLVDYHALAAAWTASWWAQCEAYASDGVIPQRP
jgi:hypothetical protein